MLWHERKTKKGEMKTAMGGNEQKERKKKEKEYEGIHE